MAFLSLQTIFFPEQLTLKAAPCKVSRVDHYRKNILTSNWNMRMELIRAMRENVSK